VLGETIKGFLSKGYSIDLIFPLYHKRDRHSISSTQNINEYVFDSILYHKVATKRYFSYILKLLFFPYFKFKVNRIYNQNLKDKIYNVVYGIGPMGSYAISKLPLKSNPVTVARYLGVASSYERFVEPMKKFLLYPDILGFKAKSDIIVITNDGTKGDEFIKKVNNSANNILFYRNGINKELFLKRTPKDYIKTKYNLCEDTKVLLLVSRLSKLKRVDRSISLAEELSKQYKNFKLFIVGDGNFYQKLSQSVKTKELEKYIMLVGPVPHSELISYYNSADLFLSFYDTSNAGNPLFEAMLAGNCIITINTGNTKEFVPHNAGFVFDKFDAKVIGEKVIELLEDENRRELIGKQAKQYINETFLNWKDRIDLEISSIENSTRDT
jgi:glycosyltransferase involved in cell wall biosynthesis